jgi:DNA processing protein
MTTIETRDWLALSLASGVGLTWFWHLVNRFGSARAVLQAPGSELKKLPGIRGQHLAALARSGELRSTADLELKKLKRLGGQALVFHDSAYPELLRQIAQPPPVIYVNGNSELLNATSVAIVGSRAATSYGRRVSHSLARDLAMKGLCVVSGLALGIDTEAHIGCLAGCGATVGVLGCGLDVVYPRTNRNLFKAVTEKGLLVSEYPLGTPPEPFRFPARNRIIAGLSLGIVVVEASKKSGSLITVQFGLEEGREIFAVPGQVDSFKSAGAHWLLQQGASLVVSADDIMSHLSLQQVGSKRVEPETDLRAGLDRESLALLSIIETYPQPRQEILSRSGLSAARLSELLLMLELETLVEILPGDEVRRLTKL